MGRLQSGNSSRGANWPVRRHEASERADSLIETFFGETIVEIHGRRVQVHHAFMPKSPQSPALKVADFVMHAAGRQVRNRMEGKSIWGKDFTAVFHSRPHWSSFIAMEEVEAGGDRPAQE
jgi:hypothetical protein